STVSLLCPNILPEPSYIAWFKQINGSLPLCIVTQFVNKKQWDSIYFNGFKKDHMEMSANKTFSSLKIVNVDVSDSGMFYCGSFLTNYMKFHNKTQLVVVNGNTLTLILSGLVLLPTVFAIVVLIRMKERNKQKGM
ncbi:hypothetical protein PO909_024413, partial [Leuciscus waleckii]